jgi:hypothetical protein
VSGSNKFTNVKDYPLTTTSLVSFDTEGKIYAKYLARSLPNAKYAILYQNDDLGKDYTSMPSRQFSRRILNGGLSRQLMRLPIPPSIRRSSI